VPQLESSPAQTSFALDDGTDCKALLFRPETQPQSGSPAVLVLHDILGFTDDLARLTERFADSGYVAMAPDFYGGRKKPMCVVQALKALSSGEGRPFEIMEQARLWLSAQEGVDETKIGIVGFCLGGGFAVLQAARSDLAFVGTFYGESPQDKETLAEIPPCFAGYGDRDKVFIKSGRRLKSHLEELDKPHEVRIYEDVGHSYMNELTGVMGKAAAYSPLRARYDEVAAEDSWSAMLEFFAEHLR